MAGAAVVVTVRHTGTFHLIPSDWRQPIRFGALERRLVLIAMVAVLPLAVLAFYILEGTVRQQRETLIGAAYHTLQGTMAAIDAEFESSMSVLDTLAASPRLAEDDLVGFRSEAEALVARRPGWTNIVLSRPGAIQIMNTLVPAGKPLKSGIDPSGIAEAIAAGRPVVGNIVYGPTSRRHLYSVKTPVMRNGQPLYVLSAVISPSRIQDILAQQELPNDAIVTIADQRHVSAARSLNGEAWVGKPVSASLSILLNTPRRDRYGITHTLEGKPVYTITQRSRHSGWVAAMGIPVELIDQPADRLRLSLALGLVLSVAAGVLVAFHIGRSIFRLRQQEQEALEKAEQANTAKDEFLAMLGHELRNPLAPIVTAAHLLKLAPNDPDKVLQANAVIDRNARHLVRLVNDLLDVSRVTRRLVTLQMAEVDVNAILPEALEQVEQLMTDHRHTLDTHAASAPAVVRGDRTRLVQVIVNLLQNAAKFTPDGGRITLEVRNEADKVLIVVGDNGIGMPPALIGQVFDLFKQGERGLDRSKGGLGIGLSLTRGLVELHGGEVRADSPGEGLGSTFTVTLPRARAPGASPPPG